MDANDLTAEQCEKLLTVIGPALTWFSGLRQRMEETRWPAGNRNRRLVEAIYTALLELRMDLHYRTCKLGLGDGPRRTQDSSGGADETTTL